MKIEKINEIDSIEFNLDSKKGFQNSLSTFQEAAPTKRRFQSSKANLRRLKAEAGINHEIKNLVKTETYKKSAVHSAGESEVAELDNERLVVEALEKYSQNPKKFDPFYYSIHVGDYKTALILLDYTQDVNVHYTHKDGHGKRVYHYHRYHIADTNGSQETALDVLLRNFNFGSQRQKEQLLIKMLEKGAHIYYQIPRRSNNFLDFPSVFYSLERAISFRSSKETISWLLENSHPESFSWCNSLLLVTAVKAGNIELSKLLIDKGGNPFLSSFTVRGCDNDLVRYQHLIPNAIESQKLEMVKFVIEEIGLSIDDDNLKKDVDLLSLCVRKRSVPILEYLLSRGVDPNKNSKALQSALQLEVNKSNSHQVLLKKEIIAILLKYGAKI